MVTVAQTPPAPKALLSPAQVLPSSCPSQQSPTSCLPTPPLPSAPWNSTHPWIWAQVTMPIFTFPNPHPARGT